MSLTKLKSYEMDRQDEMLQDALEGIPEEDVALHCEHEPRYQDFYDWDYTGEELIHSFKCVRCGVNMKEKFRLSERIFL